MISRAFLGPTKRTRFLFRTKIISRAFPGPAERTRFLFRTEIVSRVFPGPAERTRFLFRTKIIFQAFPGPTGRSRFRSRVIRADYRETLSHPAKRHQTAYERICIRICTVVCKTISAIEIVSTRSPLYIFPRSSL